MSNPTPDEPAQADTQARATQAEEAERARRRRWLLVLLLLLLLLICGLIAFVSCRDTDDVTGGQAGATPNTSPSGPVVVTTATDASPSDPDASSAPPSSPSAATLTMPNVVGKDADDADMTLRDEGFTDISFVDADGAPAALLESWVVAEQSVRAGTTVPASEPIVLTVKEKTNGRG
jgi:hypothetical protein